MATEAPKLPTNAEARALYISAGGPDDHEPADWQQIAGEMRTVILAKTDRGGGDSIRWWGCWDNKYTATGFAKRVRSEWREMLTKRNGE